MKKSLLVIPVALIVPLFMSYSTPLCACLPDGTMLGIAIGVYPMDVSPDAARSAFLQRLPVGTPESRIKETLTHVFEKHCRPAKPQSGYECRFEERDVNSIWGKYREGFRVDMDFDPKRELQHVRFTKFRDDL